MSDLPPPSMGDPWPGMLEESPPDIPQRPNPVQEVFEALGLVLAKMKGVRQFLIVDESGADILRRGETLMYDLLGKVLALNDAPLETCFLEYEDSCIVVGSLCSGHYVVILADPGTSLGFVNFTVDRFRRKLDSL